MFWYKVEERSETRLVPVSSEANQKNRRERSSREQQKLFQL